MSLQRNLFVHQWAYRSVDNPEVPRGVRLLPTRVKSGLAASLRRGLAHHVREAAIVTEGDSAVLTVRWLCGGGSVSAIPVSPDMDYVTCQKCKDAEGLPEGPVVYRCIADDGVVIYIGSTTALVQRLQAHKTGSHWWDEVEKVEPETFPSEGTARVAEAVAIAKEQPFYNVDNVHAVLARSPTP